MGLQSRTKWIRRALSAGVLPAGVEQAGEAFTLKGFVWRGGARAGQQRILSARGAAKQIAYGWKPTMEAQR